MTINGKMVINNNITYGGNNMNKTVRRVIIHSIVIFTFFSQAMGIQGATKAIQIELNQQIQGGINPIVEKGTTLVPLRSISNLLGATVHWDGPSKTIKVSQDNVINTLRLNQKAAYKEDKHGKTKIQLALPPQVKKGITYVPLRYIAESLNIRVSWDPKTNIIKMTEPLSYKGKKIFLGDSNQTITNLIGKPTFTMADEAYKYLFYVDDYENLLILYSRNSIIAGFMTTGKTMKFRDVTYNGKKNTNITTITTIQDNYDGHKVVGMVSNINHKSPSTKASLSANERIIFELTNGFRAHHKTPPLKYNSKLSDVARKHSKDMADKDYFSHTSLDGTTMSKRIERGGIDWAQCGENIAAGYRTELATFDQWLNSLGHRENMLNQSGDLGVGSAYNSKSSSGYYHTQNFARIR